MQPTGTPPRLDFARLTKRLRLSDRARDNGLRELPASSEDQLDEPQQQLVEHVRRESEHICAGYAASLTELNRRIRELDVARRLRALKHAPTELSRQLRELSARVELGLQRAAGEHEAALAAYDAFRVQHRLEREPRYPTSLLAPIALLLSVAVAKAGLTLHVLGNDPRLVPLVVPLLFADVLLAFLLGRAMPWVAAHAWRERLIGLGAVAGFVAWSAGFNQLARLTPVGDTALLSAIGLALSALAALIGFCSDDRTPGYGQLHRQLSRVRSERDYWRAACVEGAGSLHERQRARIDTAERGVEEDLDALARAITAKGRLLDEIRDFSRNFENATNALLRLYRDTNAGYRMTPAPAYFERTWRLNLPDHLADSVDGDLARLHEAQRARECAERLAEHARARARETRDEFLRRCGEADGNGAVRSRCA